MSRDQTAKADGGKTNPLLLQKDCAPALYLIQRVLDYGLQKYSRQSWHKVEQDRWDEAARRHQQQIDMGQTFDYESNLHHRAHQIAGLIILFSHELGLGIDIDELEDLGKFNDAPQEHKGLTVSAIENGVVPVSIAKVGELIKCTETLSGPVWGVLMGEHYRVRAFDIVGMVHIEDMDGGTLGWWDKKRFY